MSDEKKYMDLEEFYKKGFLQEVNRQFFHPHGLALAMNLDVETGELSFGGIWDSRDDPEGWIFADGELDNDESRDKANAVQDEFFKHLVERYLRGEPVQEILGHYDTLRGL